jgi:hypothetical protein
VRKFFQGNLNNRMRVLDGFKPRVVICQYELRSTL